MISAPAASRWYTKSGTKSGAQKVVQKVVQKVIQKVVHKTTVCIVLNQLVLNQLTISDLREIYYISKFLKIKFLFRTVETFDTISNV